MLGFRFEHSGELRLGKAIGATTRDGEKLHSLACSRVRWEESLLDCGGRDFSNPKPEAMQQRTLIVVRVKAASRKPGISVHDAEIEIRVNEAPQDGRANEAVRAALAEALDLPRGRVTLTRGARSKQKTFAIDGLEHDTILARLRAHCAE